MCNDGEKMARPAERWRKESNDDNDDDDGEEEEDIQHFSHC